MTWCAGRLPVPEVMAVDAGVLSMSTLPGVNLTEVPIECAVALIVEALHLIHSVPTDRCPFQADWATRLHQAAHRVSRPCRQKPASLMGMLACRIS
jgi:aminoglycoside phosphotransferase